MPASAYGLVALFVVISGVSGWLGARIIGPRKARAAVFPALAALGSLYLVGHRSTIRVGPQIEVLGWQVSLAFDVVVTAATTLLTAGLQRRGLRLFQAQKRGARGDRLA